MCNLLDSSQIELKLRVKSHPLSPYINLMSISKSYAVVEATCNIHYLVIMAEINLSWVESNSNRGVLEAELPIYIPSPCEDFSLCCQDASKKISTNNFGDWLGEINAKRY